MSMRRVIAGRSGDEIKRLTKEQLEEPITTRDLEDAIGKTQPSVSPQDLKKFEVWKQEYGSN